MSDLSLVLEDPLDSFVEEQVRSGAYPDAAAVIRAGLDRLRVEAETEVAREARFRLLLQEGIDELDRGEGIEVEDMGVWLRSLRSDATA